MYIRTNRKLSVILFIAIVLTFAMAFLTAYNPISHTEVAFAADEPVDALVGKGTQNEPFLIQSKEDFLFLSAQIAEDGSQDGVPYKTAWYGLLTDLDFEGATISPVGSAEHSFDGNFNGNGKLIKNVIIDSQDNGVGLFGVVGNGGIICNLGVINGDINNSLIAQIGGLVGINYGTIENAFFNGTLVGFSSVGGLVGENHGMIIDSFSSGSVEANASDAFVGGLVGKNNGKLNFSYTIAEVSCTNATPKNVGGIVGGITNVNATPYYAYFDKSYSSYKGEVMAIGGDISSIDNKPIEIDDPGQNGNIVKGLTDEELNAGSVDIELLFFGKTNKWTSAFTADKHVSFNGPLQTVFARHEDKENLRTAVTIRKFGIDVDSEFSWGSEGNPYVINNAEQFNYLAFAVNEYKETYFGKFFAIGRDIRFNGKSTPVGNKSLSIPFSGTLDGRHHTISGYENANVGDNYVGIFGYTRYATILNLTIDSSCKLSGNKYVGSLIGYSESGTIDGITKGTVTNVESRATVGGLENVGGIIGCVNGGIYTDILSAVTFDAQKVPSGGAYGVIGGYDESPAQRVTNAWYFTLLHTSTSENPYTKVGNFGGNVMIFDNTEAGNVEARKNPDGSIVFVARDIADEYKVEYRDNKESKIYPDDSPYMNGNDYMPPKENATGATFHARLVKPLYVNDEDKPFGYYYVGQSITVPIKTVDGSYVSGVTANAPLEKEEYSYTAENASVTLTTVMTQSLNKLNVNTSYISWTTQTFALSTVYNGQPVEFPVDKLTAEEGYTIEVEYNGGTAPTDANQNATDKYTLTIVYYRDGVRMGSRQTNFRIERKELTIKEPGNALQNSKEWDNSTLPTPADLDQDSVEGIIDGDDVTVLAYMKFNTVDISNNATVTYTFSLSGEKAKNYIAPTTEKVGSLVGKITKRNVTIELENGYEGEFSGEGIAPSLRDNPINYGNTVDGSITIIPEFSFERIEDGVLGAVGKYKLRVHISDMSSMEARTNFNLKFKSAGDDKDYVEFTVKPKTVDVNYVGTTNADGTAIVYDGTEHSISAYFVNIYGDKVEVQLNGKSSQTIRDAGTYTFEETISDANYKPKYSTQPVEVVINKADRQPIVLHYQTEVTFGTDLAVTATGGGVGDGSEDGEFTYGLVDDNSDMGFFDGNLLIAKKGGTIKFVVAKGATKNYNAVSAEGEVIVNKAVMAVEIGDVEVNYGEEITYVLTYGGSSVAPDGTHGIAVLVDGKPTDGTESLKVGTHSVTLDVSDAGSDGYVFTADNGGVLTVRCAVTVTAVAKTTEYGEPVAELTYETDIEGITLEGGLTADVGMGVGEYDITVGTLITDNPYFDITFKGAKYTVTTATLTITAVSKTKIYGEPDPTIEYEVSGFRYEDTAESIALNVNIERIQGENCFEYGYRNLGISQNSPNYTVVFVNGKLTIEQATPQKASDNVKSLMLSPGTSISSVKTPEIVFEGIDGATLTGTVQWKDEIVLDFKETDTVECTVVFTPDDNNYKSVDEIVIVKVDPIEISASFTGNKSITYDGASHKTDIGYRLNNLIEGDDPGAKITYEGDFTNVGKHTISISVTNKNYKLIKSTSTFTLNITKAELVVYIEDIEELEGVEPRVSFVYEGFRASDLEEVLTSEPSVDIPKKAGTYSVEPYGATADNYEIVYRVATVKILSPSIESVEDDEGGVEGKFSGKFDAETRVEFKVKEDTSGLDNAFAEAKKAYTTLGDKSIYKYYEIKYLSGESEVLPDGEIYLSFALPEDVGDIEQLSFLAVSNTGELVYYRDVVIDGNDVKLNVTGVKGVIIARQTADNDYTMYIIIGAVAVVVIVLLIVICVKVKKKKEARYIKFKD